MNQKILSVGVCLLAFVIVQDATAQLQERIAELLPVWPSETKNAPQYDAGSDRADADDRNDEYELLPVSEVGVNESHSASDFESCSACVDGCASQCGATQRSDCGSFNDSCCSAGACCCIGTWKSNLVLFSVADAWANRGDDNHANNFGFRGGVNSAWAFDVLPFRLQLGGSFGGYDLNGRDEAEGSTTFTSEVEEQAFFTAGIYERSCVCSGHHFSWGVVYDHMTDNRWSEEADSISLGQIRARLGLAINARDEIGAAGSLRTTDDEFVSNVQGLMTVRVMNQLQVFWKRNWESGAETTIGMILPEEPGEFGWSVEGYAPLNSCLALYGNAVYVNASTSAGDTLPNGVPNSYSEGVWNVSFGVVVYFGHKALSPSVSGHPGLPLIPVADNGSLIPKIRVGEI